MLPRYAYKFYMSTYFFDELLTDIIINKPLSPLPQVAITVLLEPTVANRAYSTKLNNNDLNAMVDVSINSNFVSVTSTTEGEDIQAELIFHSKVSVTKRFYVT